MVIEVINGIVEGSNRHGHSNRISGKQKFIQAHGHGKPLHILQGSRDKSIVRVFGHGLTPDELASMLYSDDQTGSAGGDTSILDNQQGMAKVNIIIN